MRGKSREQKTHSESPNENYKPKTGGNEAVENESERAKK